MIDSIFRTGKKYYTQMFLEECKFIVKEKKMPKYIIKAIEISSDKSKENSGKESYRRINLKSFKGAIYIRKRLVVLCLKHSPFLRISTRLKGL